MPKKSKRNLNIVSVECKGFCSAVTLAGGTANVSLTAANLSNVSASFGAVAPGFQFFRLRDLSIHLYPRTSAESQLAVAFLPDGIANAPVALGDVLGILDSCYQVGSGGCTIPQQFKVPRARLSGLAKWYKCTADGADVDLESVGSLLWFGAGTEGVRTVLKFTAEFKNPTDPTVAARTLEDQLRLKIQEEVEEKYRAGEFQVATKLSSSSPDPARVPPCRQMPRRTNGGFQARGQDT